MVIKAFLMGIKEITSPGLAFEILKRFRYSYAFDHFSEEGYGIF
jgi:hypothetical protein